jgi:hypothetical protein
VYSHILRDQPKMMKIILATTLLALVQLVKVSQGVCLNFQDCRIGDTNYTKGDTLKQNCVTYRFVALHIL